MRSVKIIALALGVLGLLSPAAHADEAKTYPVGVRQVEWTEPKDGRLMWMAMFYPAVVGENTAKTFTVALATNLHLYSAPEVAFEGKRHPLIMLSHGRGSSAWDYAWLAQKLASHGYIVAALNHY